MITYNNLQNKLSNITNALNSLLQSDYMRVDTAFLLNIRLADQHAHQQSVPVHQQQQVQQEVTYVDDLRQTEVFVALV